MIAQTVGHDKILSKLGEGGIPEYGAVYLGPQGQTRVGGGVGVAAS